MDHDHIAQRIAAGEPVLTPKTPAVKLTPAQILALAYARINGVGVYILVHPDDPHADAFADEGRISAGQGVPTPTINVLQRLGLVTVERRPAYSSIGSRRDKHRNSRKLSMTWEARLTQAGHDQISQRMTMDECVALVRRAEQTRRQERAS